MGIEEYVHAWRSKLMAAATSDDAQAPSKAGGGRSPAAREREDAKTTAPALLAGTRLGDSPTEWPLAVRQHVDRIFTLFMEDFDVVGELQNGEGLWF